MYRLRKSGGAENNKQQFPGLISFLTHSPLNRIHQFTARLCCWLFGDEQITFMISWRGEYGIRPYLCAFAREIAGQFSTNEFSVAVCICVDARSNSIRIWKDLLLFERKLAIIEGIYLWNYILWFEVISNRDLFLYHSSLFSRETIFHPAPTTTSLITTYRIVFQCFIGRLELHRYWSKTFSPWSPLFLRSFFLASFFSSLLFLNLSSKALDPPHSPFYKRLVLTLNYSSHSHYFDNWVVILIHRRLNSLVQAITNKPALRQPLFVLLFTINTWCFLASLNFLLK